MKRFTLIFLCCFLTGCSSDLKNSEKTSDSLAICDEAEGEISEFFDSNESVPLISKSGCEITAVESELDFPEKSNIHTISDPDEDGFLEQRLRQLCDNNILLMDMHTRKYSVTFENTVFGDDKNYVIYEFGDVKTYAEYIELLFDTYVKDLADFYVGLEYGFDEGANGELIVYDEKTIMVIDNVQWDDYQFDIINIDDGECTCRCTSWEYISNHPAEGITSTEHTVSVVLCEDGIWRLKNSFF